MNILRYYNAVSDEDKNKKYAVIKQCITMLEGKGDAALVDSMIGDGSLQPFSVGRKIKVDKDGITIGRRRMDIRDIGRMRISEEGSMALYDRYGKKICGTFTVNYMMENIELLCWCLHHYGVEAEITSGKLDPRMILITSSMLSRAISRPSKMCARSSALFSSYLVRLVTTSS